MSRGVLQALSLRQGGLERGSISLGAFSSLPLCQIQKMVRVYIPEATKACPCSRHRFGGRLPMPRDQATMPYWVPRVLRFHKKVRGRLAEA